MAAEANLLSLGLKVLAQAITATILGLQETIVLPYCLLIITLPYCLLMPTRHAYLVILPNYYTREKWLGPSSHVCFIAIAQLCLLQ
jgi:hypothetical protein